MLARLLRRTTALFMGSALAAAQGLRTSLPMGCRRMYSPNDELHSDDIAASALLISIEIPTTVRKHEGSHFATILAARARNQRSVAISDHPSETRISTDSTTDNDSDGEGDAHGPPSTGAAKRSYDLQRRYH